MARSSLIPLVTENLELLHQTAKLINELTPEEYVRRHDELGCSSIGQHVRHITGHYEALLRDHFRIDYDDRLRGTAVERCPMTSQHSLREIEGNLWEWASAIREGVPTLSVLYAAEGQHPTQPMELGTSHSRELAFLANHTLHHMAIISILARNMKVRPSENFGMARSTQRFLSEQQQVKRVGERIAL